MDAAEATTRLQRQLGYQQTISEVMSACSRAATIQEALGEVIGLVTRRHPLKPGSAYLFDDWAGRLRMAASAGMPEELDRSIALGDGVVGSAAEERRTVILQGDSQEDKLRVDTGIGILEPAAVVAVPMLYQESLHGVLVFGSLTQLTEHSRRFLEHVARHVAVAVHNLEQYQEVVELSRHLNDKSREIARQNAELERANRLKSQFLANVSHELRTPLNAIIGFSEILKDGVVGDLEADQQEYVEEIFDSGEHLLSLINEILDLSKVEAGKMALDIEVTNLHELLENALSIVRERAYDDGVELIADLDDSLEPARVDPRKLRQILYNLLSNAVKFTEKGGEVRLEAGIVDEGETSNLEIRVTDTGIGITPEDIERLFDPFEQAEASTSRSYEGTGLGLTLVRKLTELHSGTVTVDSEVGEGSRFEVVIPLDLDQSPPETAEEVTGASDVSPDAHSDAFEHSDEGDAPVILVIEDDDSSAELMDSHLARAGYRTRRINDASQLDEALDEVIPDLVLIDLLVPDGHGPSIVEKLQLDDRTDQVPVIIASNIADEMEGGGFALGAASLFQKPIDADALVRSIESRFETPVSGSEGGRVMIVDDDPGSVEIVAKRVEESGFQAVRAFSGREALALAHEEPPDLVVLDLMMPNMSGFEVIRELRNTPGTADVPVIVLTAKILTQQDRKRLRKDAATLIEKQGFEPATFVDAVRAELPRSKSPPPDSSARLSQRPMRTGVSQVMIVGFEPRDAQMIANHLSESGFIAIEMSDDDDMQALVRRHRPRAVIVDFDQLAPQDEQFFLNVRDRDRPPPVIAASTDRMGDLADGPAVVSVLPKPIPRNELVAALKRLTEDHPEQPLVLVCDDEPASLRVVTGFLEGEPYRVETALGGREALNLIEERTPDLLILDLMMPECDGFDVLDRLESSPDTEALPVIILTSKSMRPSERRRLAECTKMVVTKSETNREDFAQRLRRIVTEVHQ